MSTCTASRAQGKIRCVLDAGHYHQTQSPHQDRRGMKWQEPGGSTLPPPPENVEQQESVIVVRHQVAQAMASAETAPEPEPKPRKRRRRTAKKANTTDRPQERAEKSSGPSGAGH